MPDRLYNFKNRRKKSTIFEDEKRKCKLGACRKFGTEFLIATSPNHLSYSFEVCFEIQALFSKELCATSLGTLPVERNIN